MDYILLIMIAVTLIFSLCFYRNRMDRFISEREKNLIEDYKDHVDRLERKVNILMDGITILGYQLMENGVEPDFRLATIDREKSDKFDTATWKKEERISSIKSRLIRLEKNLAELESQRASFGIRVPIDLINEIDKTQTEIERLEDALEAIYDSLT